MKIDLDIQDGISPELRKIAAQMKNPRPLLYAAGKAAEKAIKAHYKSLPPNAKGWASQGFWKGEGADKTMLVSFDANQATVTVDSVNMVHKFHGGTVTPKRGSALAIPLNADAAAAGSPRNGLIPGLFRAGNALVVMTGTSMRAMYALVKSVTHRPDPRAFVTEKDIERPVLDTLRAKLDVILRAGR